MPQLLYAVINSGFVVSDVKDLSKYGSISGIDVPTITSGDLLLQGSFATTSAGFHRLIETRNPGSGDMKFATGPGSVYVTVPLDRAMPNYVRLETSVQQADTRTLTMLVRAP